MNDLITSLNLSKRCKIIRVIDTRLSIIMSEDEIRRVFECCSKIMSGMRI